MGLSTQDTVILGAVALAGALYLVYGRKSSAVSTTLAPAIKSSGTSTPNGSLSDTGRDFVAAMEQSVRVPSLIYSSSSVIVSSGFFLFAWRRSTRTAAGPRS